MVQNNFPLKSVFNLISIALANFAVTDSIITALISVRLIFHSVSMRKAMGTDADSMRMYTSVWTILVESSALYGTFSLWFIVTYAIAHPLSKMSLPILGQVQVRQFLSSSVVNWLTHRYLGYRTSPCGPAAVKGNGVDDEDLKGRGRWPGQYCPVQRPRKAKPLLGYRDSLVFRSRWTDGDLRFRS